MPDPRLETQTNIRQRSSYSNSPRNPSPPKKFQLPRNSQIFIFDICDCHQSPAYFFRAGWGELFILKIAYYKAHISSAGSVADSIRRTQSKGQGAECSDMRRAVELQTDVLFLYGWWPLEVKI